jgi:glycine cleavage system transcriptional repressor
MPLFALSAVGRDRPGIVAAVSRVLLEQELNIEDSQMTILRGHFAMTLIVAAPQEVDTGQLRAGLERVRAQLSLDAVSLSEVTEAGDAEPRASHIISVYGVDHPGIVHAVSSALAERGWTITDLTTRLVGDEGASALYAMMIEVALPDDVPIAALDDAMKDVAARQGVEITSRPLERDTL